MKKQRLVFLLLITLSVSAFASVGKKQVRFRLEDSVTALADETDIYLDLGISAAFIKNEDAPKNLDTIQKTIPQIYSFTSNGVACYSNGYGNFTQSVIIAMGFRVAGGSTYIISTPLLDNFDPTSILQLEDRSTGIFHDLRQGPYSFYAAQAQLTNGRFFLHVSFPPVVGAIPSGCANDNGIISIGEDSSIVWSACQLYDSSMNLIGSYSHIKGNFSFANLQEGNYNLAFVYGIYSSVKPIHIDGNLITANILATTIYTSVGQDISFNANAHNATNYTWDFGDSTRITGVSTIDYNYGEPGTYTVSVQCSNPHGCSTYAYITIYVSPYTGIKTVQANNFKIFADHKNIIVDIAIGTSYQFEVYNTLGQLILSGPVASSPATISMPGHIPGVYIVSLKGSEGAYTQKIFLE